MLLLILMHTTDYSIHYKTHVNLQGDQLGVQALNVLGISMDTVQAEVREVINLDNPQVCYTIQIQPESRR